MMELCAHKINVVGFLWLFSPAAYCVYHEAHTHLCRIAVLEIGILDIHLLIPWAHCSHWGYHLQDQTMKQFLSVPAYVSSISFTENCNFLNALRQQLFSNNVDSDTENTCPIRVTGSENDISGMLNEILFQKKAVCLFSILFELGSQKREKM